MRLQHIPSKIIGEFVKTTNPTGKPETTVIKTNDGRDFFAPSSEFQEYSNLGAKVSLLPVRMRVTLGIELNMAILLSGGMESKELISAIEALYPGYEVDKIKFTEIDRRKPGGPEQDEVFRKCVPTFITVDLHKKEFENFLKEEYETL